jgi:hypothetical protein
MLPRQAWLAGLLVSAVAAGCAPPAPPEMSVSVSPAPPASAAPAGRRTVVLSRAQVERPSELTAVTEDRPDPEAQRQFEARIAQPAVALVAAPAPPKVTAIRLDDTRRGEAPDMKPVGEIFSATLAEGKRATMPVSIPAGACETFIAQGGLGVIEVDLFLTVGDGSSARILAEDPSTGPIAVIGGRGKCLQGKAGGTEAVLHAAVRRGAGVVLVRVYKKG